MEKNRTDLLPRLIVHVMLFSSHSAEDDRVDSFEVRRIGQKRHSQVLSIRVFFRLLSSPVVFHVSDRTPLSADPLRSCALELCEDFTLRSLYDV